MSWCLHGWYFMAKCLHTYDLVCTLLTYMAYFVYWLLLGGRLFTYFMARCTYIWWPIRYIYLLLITYSVHKDVYEMIFCTRTFFIFDLFCTSTTCSWLCTLVNLGPSLMSLSVRIHPAGWLILYIRNFSTAYSVHIPPHVGINSVRTTSSWPSLYTSELIFL